MGNENESYFIKRLMLIGYGGYVLEKYEDFVVATGRQEIEIELDKRVIS